MMKTPLLRKSTQSILKTHKDTCNGIALNTYSHSQEWKNRE
jgi:hypothetical protein